MAMSDLENQHKATTKNRDKLTSKEQPPRLCIVHHHSGTRQHLRIRILNDLLPHVNTLALLMNAHSGTLGSHIQGVLGCHKDLDAPWEDGGVDIALGVHRQVVNGVGYGYVGHLLESIVFWEGAVHLDSSRHGAWDVDEAIVATNKAIGHPVTLGDTLASG